MKNYAKKILLATITSLLLSAGFTSAASRLDTSSETASSTQSVSSVGGESFKPCVGGDYR